MKNPIFMTMDELKAILLTVDGAGKSFKSEVLQELISRVKSENLDPALLETK